MAGAGRGLALWPSIGERLGLKLDPVQTQLLPRAREIVRLAVPAWRAGLGVGPEQAVPVYLRNDVAKPSRK